MDNDRAVLTIAIPTYNRCVYLKQSLNVLVPQLTQERRVDLLVSDNASTDNTQELIRELQSRGAHIRYMRNATNLGAEYNILQCYEEARSKYVWILGDDDVVEPFGLEVVLAHLLRVEYDLIAVKTRGFTGQYSPAKRPSRDAYRIFTRAEDLASYVHVFFTFISGIIVNKDMISVLPHRPFEELIGTGLVQLGWVYTALEHNRRSLAIQTPVVAALTDNTGGYSLFRVFGANFGRITQQWLTADEVKRPIIRGTLQSFFPYYLLLQKEGDGEFIMEDPHRLLKPVFGNYAHYWLFNFPIIELPRWLATAWFCLVKAINKADMLLGRPLLRIPMFDKPSL